MQGQEAIPSTLWLPNSSLPACEVIRNSFLGKLSWANEAIEAAALRENDPSLPLQPLQDLQQQLKQLSHEERMQVARQLQQQQRQSLKGQNPAARRVEKSLCPELNKLHHPPSKTTMCQSQLSWVQPPPPATRYRTLRYAKNAVSPPVPMVAACWPTLNSGRVALGQQEVKLADTEEGEDKEDRAKVPLLSNSRVDIYIRTTSYA